jgi:hypothetical protein
MPNYSPPNLSGLSEFDNYEIYSLIVAVAPSTEYGYVHRNIAERWKSGGRLISNQADYNIFAALHPGGYQTRTEDAWESSVSGDGFHQQTGFFFFDIYLDTPARIVTNNLNKGRYLYAIQSFAPKYKIDFTALKNRMDLYPPKQGKSWELQTAGNYNLPKKFEQNVDRFNWTKLAVNGVVVFEGIATETRKLTVDYWAHNYLENHPLIDFTADHRRIHVNMFKGKKFLVLLNHPIAETLTLSVSSGNIPALTEVSSTTVTRPTNISQYLSSSFVYGQNIQANYQALPPINEPNKGDKNNLFTTNSWLKLYLNGTDVLNDGNFYYGGGTASGNELKFNGSVVAGNYPRIYSEITTAEITLTYQELPALNDVWGMGRNSLNYPELDARIRTLADVDTTYYDLFLKPQLDNSIGDLIMDSPIILENNRMLTAITNALDADKYSTNTIDAGKPRITTIGWYSENTARVLGLRFDDNGDIDFEKEKSDFMPATLNNPSTGEADSNGKKNGYNLTSFGLKGRFMPFLPTTYNAGNKEEILHDVVADIPQMLEATLRQIDKSLGIQHGSEIRLNSLDGKVQSFPNQLSLLLHLSRQIEEIKFSTAKSFNVAVVTGAEVRELFSGIGIPATNKFLTLQDTITGHEVQLPYFGHQKNQLSILKELSTIKINLAVQNGMMLPKKSNPLFDPFKRFK